MAEATAIVNSPDVFQCFTRASLTVVWASAGNASARIAMRFVFMISSWMMDSKDRTTAERRYSLRQMSMPVQFYLLSALLASGGIDTSHEPLAPGVTIVRFGRIDQGVY